MATSRANVVLAVRRDPNVARLPVIDVDGQIVATGIGSLELGVPNPYCPRGRTVRLANVITHPEHRRKGYGTLAVDDVTEWAISIDADRIDLSATLEGQRILRAGRFRPGNRTTLEACPLRRPRSADCPLRQVGMRPLAA